MESYEGEIDGEHAEFDDFSIYSTEPHGDTDLFGDQMGEDKQGQSRHVSVEQSELTVQDFTPDWDLEKTEEDEELDVSSTTIQQKKDEGSIVDVGVHGYTLVERTVSQEDGSIKVVRNFYPRIHQRIRTFKSFVPVKVVFKKLSNDMDIVEEEEEIEEEMDTEEITSTILVKKVNEAGSEIVEEEKVVELRFKDPSTKRRFMKIKMINDRGQSVEELVELNGDDKRTNEIMKLAVPFMKKRTRASEFQRQTLAMGEELETFQRLTIALPGWGETEKQKEKSRIKAISRLKQALDEQKKLKEINKYLGKKLCEYLDLKGPKDPNFNYDDRGNIEEEKLKYEKTLLEFYDVINFIFSENKNRAEKIAQAEADTQREGEVLKAVKQKLYDLEEQMVKDVDPVEEAKAKRSMTFKELVNQQKMMDNSLARIRLDFIRSQIALKNLQDREAAHQAAIDKMEKVDFINYEVLRNKTKNLTDKLDLKEKQVQMMKDRLTQKVQALAHVRLKCDHLTAENEKLIAETKNINEETKALRRDCLEVQMLRRKLEKDFSQLTTKEGLEKFPYLLKEMGTVDTKRAEQSEQLTRMVIKCSELKGILEDKLNEHNEKVEKRQRVLNENKEKTKLFSFEFQEN